MRRLRVQVSSPAQKEAGSSVGLAFVVFCGGINKPKKPVNHALAVSGGELALVEVIVHPQAGTKKHDQ